jgi:hypothetical protein
VAVNGSGWVEYFADGDVIFNDGSNSTSGKWKRLEDGRIKVETLVRGTGTVEVYAVSVEGSSASFTSSEGEAKAYQRSTETTPKPAESPTQAVSRHLKDEEAQMQTLAEIRSTGKAMFAWLTDQVGAAAAGEQESERRPGHDIDLLRYSRISRPELERILIPHYLQAVPELDAWGNPYEYYLSPTTPLAPQVMGIRSPGRDGVYSALEYTRETTEPSDFDEDIVWADGFFVRYPQARKR